jgi:hypothetical protein
MVPGELNQRHDGQGPPEKSKKLNAWILVHGQEASPCYSGADLPALRAFSFAPQRIEMIDAVFANQIQLCPDQIGSFAG